MSRVARKKAYCINLCSLQSTQRYIELFRIFYTPEHVLPPRDTRSHWDNLTLVRLMQIALGTLCCRYFSSREQPHDTQSFTNIVPQSRLYNNQKYGHQQVGLSASPCVPSCPEIHHHPSPSLHSSNLHDPRSSLSSFAHWNFYLIPLYTFCVSRSAWIGFLAAIVLTGPLDYLEKLMLSQWSFEDYGPSAEIRKRIDMGQKRSYKAAFGAECEGWTAVGVSRSFPCMFVASFYAYTHMLAFF